MIVMIVIMVILLTQIYRIANTTEDKEAKYAFASLLALLAFCLIVICVIYFFPQILPTQTKEEAKIQNEKHDKKVKSCEIMNEEKITPIYNFKVGSELEGDISGNFIFLDGNISETTYYSFYKEMEDKSKMLIQMHPNDVVVYNDAPQEGSYMLERTTCEWNDFFGVIHHTKTEIHINENFMK